MKRESDPIQVEMDRILQEMWPQLHIDKKCLVFCGAKCNCKGAVPIRDIDFALEQAKSMYKIPRV